MSFEKSEPDGRATKFSLSAKIVDKEVRTVYTVLTFDAAEIATYAKPGQFVTISIPESSRILPRAFSIYRVFENKLSVAVYPCGPGTRIIADARSGDTLFLAGPFGIPFPEPKEQHAVFVAGGYGSACLLEQAKCVASKQKDVTVFLGASHKEKLFAVDEYLAISSNVNCYTDDGSAGKKGFVTAHLSDELIGLSSKTNVMLYACGPMGMLQAVGEIASACRVKHLLSLEETMACGFGICMTCVVPELNNSYPKRVCTQGPAFSFDQIDWERFTKWNENAGKCD